LHGKGIRERTGVALMGFIALENYTLQETFQSTFNTSTYAAIMFAAVYVVFVYAIVLGGITRVAKFAVRAVFSNLKMSLKSVPDRQKV